MQIESISLDLERIKITKFIYGKFTQLPVYIDPVYKWKYSDFIICLIIWLLE